jgi:hypothetical protein
MQITVNSKTPTAYSWKQPPANSLLECTPHFPLILQMNGMRNITFFNLRHPYVKRATKSSLPKQKSQTIKQADSLEFTLSLLLRLKAGCVEFRKHSSFSISPCE